MKSAERPSDDAKKRLKVEDRAPSPIPFSPPSSPQSRRQEVTRLGSQVSLISDPPSSKAKPKAAANNEKDPAVPPPSSPIAIPVSKAKKSQATPGLEASSLNSLSQVPASSFLVGRSHYSSQPITIEYYVTERIIEDGTGAKTKKQATTIRSIGDYQVIRTIGSGSTGKVKLAVNLNSGQKVAVKIISRKYIQEPGKNSKETPASRRRRILREAAILNLASHPNIVRLHDLYVTDEYYCMIFEYVDGGQMLDYIISHGKLAEPAARRFFAQLLSAVSYCHANGIVHRDLKIENVLIDGRGDIKLVDFGLSNFYDPDAKLKTFCGSLYFAAPELLRGIAYTGPEVDVWSLGIILFVLVAGKVPFDDKSLSALHEKIKSGHFTIPQHLSLECQNLLRIMIEVDPQKRATMAEVMAHPWMQPERENLPLSSVNSPPPPPLDKINHEVEAFLIREFPYQYEEDEIRQVLQAATLDNRRLQYHPIVALYRLVQNKQERMKFALNGFESPAVPIKRESAQPDATVVPSSLPERFQRKRSDSLPVQPVVPAAAAAAVSITKSKRSASLQTDGAAVLPQVSEELAVRSRTSAESDTINVRTVYLKGIFSVNTTSTKRPTVIRELVIDCLTRLHGHEIIFLDRESYFICEYQAHTQAQAAGKGHRSILDDDDSSKAEVANDIDVSRLDLNEASAWESVTATPSKLTFGAVPARSIRFEIHIVRVALLGMYGVQFKRISGDFAAYKTLCTRLIEEFNL